MSDVMIHRCVVCYFELDEKKHGKWESMPDWFLCPRCGTKIQDFEEIASTLDLSFNTQSSIDV